MKTLPVVSSSILAYFIWNLGSHTNLEPRKTTQLMCRHQPAAKDSAKNTNWTHFNHEEPKNLQKDFATIVSGTGSGRRACGGNGLQHIQRHRLSVIRIVEVELR
jgi:hypothetical protein